MVQSALSRVMQSTASLTGETCDAVDCFDTCDAVDCYVSRLMQSTVSSTGQVVSPHGVMQSTVSTGGDVDRIPIQSQTLECEAVPRRARI